MSKIQLSEKFSIAAIDYAGQGNAILGIRDAGKTYTAMSCAEQLMDAGIPIIVFDPVGVWKNLKIGTGKHKGYPIVTAGGEESDIRLTVTNATDIVHAAMKENISLVIDLYSPELINKSTWIRIVQETVDLLMYQNKSHGMRHLFIEESAEFIPQRLQPQHAKVYSSIERLARMGRNAKLGYTIINQRAEEVNKAILEICSLSLLHKQVGKNSLLSISKWLDLLQIENKNDIIKSLPTLQQGECWIVGQGEPFKIKVAVKKTFHPDPKNVKNSEEAITIKVTDVSAFVEKLNKQLVKPIPQKVHKNIPQTEVKNIPNSAQVTVLNSTIDKLKSENSELRKENRNLKNYLSGAKIVFDRTIKIISDYQNNLPLKDPLQNNASVAIPKSFVEYYREPPRMPSRTNTTSNISSNNGTVTGGAMRMLKAAAMFHPKSITKMKMATLAGLSYTSGSFGTYVATLKREGLIQNNGNDFVITAEGLSQAGNVGELPTDPKELIEMWCNNIGSGSGASRMLRILGEHYPQEMSKQELGEASEMSHSSGSFGTYIATLKRNGLITNNGGFIKASDELFQ